ncbi:MAG: SAVED domain-containing protein [Actinomycetota bacterium]|nr:MAG: SAVED domain-containing protein [Actinomycetota bacterium]
MTSNQLPSASGVRIAGDNYQWLHAWRCCMEALHDDLTGNNSNAIIAVGVEEPGVGNGDDVVLHRAQPPHTYMQVKYAVDHRTAINLDYLDQSGVLRKMVKTYADLTNAGTPAQMRLVTNRTIDPNDLLVTDRDARDGRLLPRAAQGGPKSDRGKARAEWAEKADTDEAGLLTFLANFHLDVAYDIDRLRRETSLLMTANGLRSDDAALTLGAGWIERQVIAGHRRITLDVIKNAVASLELQAGSPWTTVSVATIKHDELADQAAVSIDWVDRIDGTTDWTRVAPLPPHTWDDLAADIRTITGQLNGDKRILITGHLRQATGFFVGTELRRVLGYEVGIRQGEQLWTGETPTTSDAITVTEHHAESGPDTAIIVNVAADAADVAADWIRSAALPVNKILTVQPSADTGAKAIPTPSYANSVATAIRDLARRHVKGDIHLFLIGPLGLAVLLGHHWNRVTTTHVYEHLGGTEYTAAFAVDA